MVLDVILIILALIVLLIASYTDLKTREVPDWLNYSLIFSALIIVTFIQFFATFRYFQLFEITFSISIYF